jgi:hypothetical protein
MKRTAGILVTLMVAIVAAQLFADVSIENRGRWPESYQELEPLRRIANHVHWEAFYCEILLLTRRVRVCVVSFAESKEESPIVLIRSP